MPNSAKSMAPLPQGDAAATAAGGDAASLGDTALGWIVRLHAGDADDGDWQAYDDWKQQDPAAQAAALQAERLWQALGPALKRPQQRRHRRQAGALAAVAIVALTGALGLGAFGPPATLLADVRTGIGERRTVALADGSTVVLDAASAIDIAFDEGHRRLRLLSGQVHVQVAPDAARPFEVEALGGTTRALGTGFIVHRGADAVDVAVTEHGVRVRGPADTASGGATVQTGEQVRYAEDGRVSAPQPVDLDVLTAWQRGRIVFVDRPLAEVMAELERYRPGVVLLRGDAVRGLSVTGSFDSTDTDALLDELQATLPVRVRRLPWVTVVEAAAAPSHTPRPTRR